MDKDTKDWTWGLQRPCPDCGFDSSAVVLGELADLIHDNARGWYDVLDRPEVGRRPAPDVWSPLEYGCHVRAVYAGVPDDAWGRPGRRSNGSLFTVASLGVYHLHDVVHHLWDVR